MRHAEHTGPIYNVRGYPVIAPEVAAGIREGEFTGVYQMSNGQRTNEPGRYFRHELGTTYPEQKGGRLAERLSGASLATVSRVDGRGIKELLADNNIRIEQ